MYNILYTASLKDKLLMGMFHCGADEKGDWKPIVLQIREFEIKKNVNEHISMMLCGIISKNDAEEFLAKQKHEQEARVTLLEEGKEEKVLFCGIVQEIHLFMEGAVYTVTLEAISYTSILDQTKRFRTFQNINQTYRELVKEVLSSYTNASVIFPASDKELGDIQVQYQETDWEFLKRMASQLGTGLVADEHLEKAAFYFGLKNGQDEMEISAEACAVRDCVAGREKYREYEFVTPELLEIGDKRIYRRMRMQVWAAQIRLINEELKCINQLRSPSKYRKAQYDNRFTPGQIMITNHCGMSVILDDENGIEIKSNKGIVLEAGETIEINCGGVVAVKGWGYV